MIKNVIFLDIDGPLLPGRSYYAMNSGQQITTKAFFDPYAVIFLERVIKEIKGKYVISSSWAHSGLDFLIETFKNNNMDSNNIHEDWMTPRKMSSSRHHEIKMWLDDHPEVDNYAILDDILIIDEKAVHVSFYDGMLDEHYQKILQIFGVKPVKIHF